MMRTLSPSIIARGITATSGRQGRWCEVKSQQIITQRIRDKPQECDLGFDFQAGVTIFDLRDRQTGIRQELRQSNAGFLSSRISKPRNASRKRWE